jgi:kynurenine aminotransferase
MPGAAWFIFVSVDNISVPEEYEYPPLVAKHGTKDWKACYFLVQEFGIASIPGTCFYGEGNKALGSRYLRFGACKSDEGLQLTAARLEQLKPYISRTDRA